MGQSWERLFVERNEAVLRDRFGLADVHLLLGVSFYPINHAGDFNIQFLVRLGLPVDRMTVVSLGHEVANQHPTSSTAAIVVISMCSICLQLSILYSSCRRVCGGSIKIVKNTHARLPYAV